VNSPASVQGEKEGGTGPGVVKVDGQSERGDGFQEYLGEFRTRKDRTFLKEMNTFQYTRPLQENRVPRRGT